MADVDCEEAAEIENISGEIISDDIIDNLDNNNENSSTNINNNEINQTKVQNKSNNGVVGATAANNETKNQRKRKRYQSQQQQRKNNKNWKMNKLRRQQSENIDLEAAAAKANNFNNFDKNSQKINPSLKFFKNLKLCRHRSFSAISKFFLPEKRPRKDLIVPPTKFLLGGNISDPLNLKNIQNEGGLAPTPKSSPITTPPKIEVIIPPNIHDPLHLLDPVDAIEYQKQLTSPIKRKRKTKHRNRNRKKKASECQGNINEPGSITENVTATTSTKDEASNLNEVFLEKEVEKVATIENMLSTEEIIPIDRDKAIRDLRLEFHEGSGRKRKISESHSNSKVKVRRMESMDKIVSPVIPQPGAWKRVVHPTPSGAPRCGPRNRTRTQSASLSEDISPSEEQKKDVFGQQLVIVATSAATAQNFIEPDKQSVIEKNVDSPVEEGQTDSTKVQKPQFKNRDAKYQYGNYNRYHGYRNLNEFMDVRLKVFMRYPHLFEGNDILDIGCNAGHITIFVAKNLHPKTITGIDIDPSLIAKCRQNLALYVKIPTATVTSTQSIDEGDDTKPTTSNDAVQKQRQQKLKRKKKVKMTESAINRNFESRQLQQCDEFFPISFPKCYGQIPQSPSPASNDVLQSIKDEPILFPKNIFFKTNNYVLKDDAMLNQDSQQYDLILCLSVTKWIHLNFGDAGLKLTFKRIFNQLRPGGKLVLEAQNWASYKKKKKLTENIYNNFKNIEFYPNKFHEYLLGPEVGFSHSYPLGVPRHLNKGFRRPIQLYIKGDFTPSQKHWSDTYYPQTPYAHRGIYAENLYMGQMMSGSKSMWGNDTPHGNYSYRFTPSQNFSATSQYYNPYETDSYLPSYNQEIQTRQYCFQSPLYLTVWSPPSGRNSQSHTPLYGSIRESDCNEHADGGKKHVYLPTDGLDDVGKSSNRSSENDIEKSPQVQHVYLNTYNDSSSGTDTSSNQKCDSTTIANNISQNSQDKSTSSNDN